MRFLKYITQSFLKFGTDSIKIDNYITVKHGFSKPPTSIVITMNSTNPFYSTVFYKNKNEFRFKVWDHKGNPATGIISFNWIAIR